MPHECPSHLFLSGKSPAHEQYSKPLLSFPGWIPKKSNMLGSKIPIINYQPTVISYKPCSYADVALPWMVGWKFHPVPPAGWLKHVETLQRMGSISNELVIRILQAIDIHSVAMTARAQDIQGYPPPPDSGILGPAIRQNRSDAFFK